MHTERDSLPSDLVQLEIDLPDALEISRMDIKALPKDWKAYPAPTGLQRLGDEWLLESLTPVLEVPSAVIPEEVDFLVNPQHSAAGAIAVTSQRPFEYDSRFT